MKNISKNTAMILFVSLASILIIFGCNTSPNAIKEADGGTVVENPGDNINLSALSGSAQKGPFVQDGIVKVYGLDNNFDQTGFVSGGEATTDEYGNYSFELRVKLDTRYIELMAKGFYFDEISGMESDGRIVLKAFSDTLRNTEININVMTTLAQDRIRFLIGQGETYEAAAIRAYNDILENLGIDEPDFTFAEDTTILEYGNSNGVLLAVSAVLMQMAHNGEKHDSLTGALSEYIGLIRQDLIDGVIDDTFLNNEIDKAFADVDLVEIRHYLETRYPDADIPDFEIYITSH